MPGIGAYPETTKQIPEQIVDAFLENPIEISLYQYQSHLHENISKILVSVLLLGNQF